MSQIENATDKPDFNELRQQVDKTDGQKYWRSLEELSQEPEFNKWVQHEFPQEPALWEKQTTRRRFLQLMGSMIAMAGLAGCTRQPTEKIVARNRMPENLVPGKPLYFASAIPLSGYGRGILVESHMGRPTKIEGNPEHADSLGAADAITQASVLSLYDPDRAKHPSKNGKRSDWNAFWSELEARLTAEKAGKGSGLRILTGAVSSPTLYRQMVELLKRFPNAKWHQYTQFNRDNERAGTVAALGQDASVRYNVAKANIILSLDSDFLAEGPGSIAYARDYAKRRKARGGKVVSGSMNRMYAIEHTPTLTGSMADHRIAAKQSHIKTLTVALAAKLGIGGVKFNGHLSDKEAHWVEVLAEDLLLNRGKSLVVADKSLPAAVHSLVHVINISLGNAGKTVIYQKTLEPVSISQSDSIKSLVAELNAGKVKNLLIFDANPVYEAPKDLEVAEAIKKASFSAHLSLYKDETSKSCQWHLSAKHYLEQWSDVRSFDGTASVVQPLIHPLYESQSAHDILAKITGSASDYAAVRDTWRSDTGNFESTWQKILHDGVIPGSAFGESRLEISSNIRIDLSLEESEGIEVVFRKDPNVGLLNEANNGWLQELPKPITRVAWENVLMISPVTAKELGIKSEDMVEVTSEGKKVTAPAWITPGHADASITLFTGYGRQFEGKIGSGIGYDAGSIRVSKSPSAAANAAVKRLGIRQPLASTQDHHSMENRHLVRSSGVEDYLHHPDFAQHVTHEPKPTDTLYDPSQHLTGDHQWGMSIDLSMCIGCNACTVACQSENNIPVVGKDEVQNGREMHWIRVDRYYEGDASSPQTVHQPVPCMQCENAPCEPVCPVGATVHSDEGLNDMTYNRCVGTRYCANNCSYKVRRFNFYQYADLKTESLKLRRNPDVTVRTRGVMEKCTYCVQRINHARIDAKKENRKIKDGEVVTACQQTCPTQAIEFGDISDKSSKISMEKADSLNYGLLTDLGTRPRTTYMARVTNPNPKLQEKKHHGDKAHKGGH